MWCQGFTPLLVPALGMYRAWDLVLQYNISSTRPVLRTREPRAFRQKKMLAKKVTPVAIELVFIW